jgi:hypothetical protein
MATKEELFAAVRLIKEHCRGTKWYGDKCPLIVVCEVACGNGIAPLPCRWPDPEEGGGKNG